MPLFDFLCENCKNKFEDLIFTKDSNPVCPKCGGKTEKLISRTTGIVQGTENKSLDYLIGTDSEKRWKKIEERRRKREKKNV